MQQNRFIFTSTLICNVLDVSYTALYQHLHHSSLASRINGKHVITDGRAKIYDEYAFCLIALSFRYRKHKHNIKVTNITLNYFKDIQRLKKQNQDLRKRLAGIDDLNRKMNLILNKLGITY